MTNLPLSEQEIVDAYIYILGRYLVIRQEHIDMAEEGVDYNVIKFNELGKAEFVNPNLDVAYLEAWFAVDDVTPIILEIPKVEGRYYTAQIMDEWAEIITNINERNYPEHPYGRYALCLKGSSPKMPEGALRVDLPTMKAKMLARVERQGDDAGAVKLQHAFKIIKVGEPVIKPAVTIPMFTNDAPIAVEAFSQPMLGQVLESAIDSSGVAALQQKNALAVADFVAESKDNQAAVDAIIKGQAFPQVVEFIRSLDSRDGQTEAELTSVYLHHWIAKIDSELGYLHNRTLSRQEIVDFATRLGLREVKYYDYHDKDSDPMEQTKINQLENLIERTIQYAERTKYYKTFKERGDELRQRLYKVGAQSEPRLIIVGRKGEA